MFLSREVAKMNMPQCFRKFIGYAMIDCSEFFDERLHISPDKETCTPAIRTIQRINV